MKTNILSCLAVLLLCTACNKSIDQLIEKKFLTADKDGGFTLYSIKQGQHYSDQKSYKAVALSGLNFIVKFDSSAIYKTGKEENQYDINKLYGFSDNNADHHQYSARIGWAWNKNALRLYAYVYNEGIVSKSEIGIVAIGTETHCSIKVAGDFYIFSMNEAQLSVPRKSATSLANGYMLYPYFGGDEPAPHDVNIRIKNL